ncbi:hypothetical protein ElyMa_001571400 [Elysia marginata]|uniref:Uncharacterized protein n=1 Tax=Elysia marginata TaxID=1093978 RepID=A0AAV4JF85_9GAST|nr:hypothetical protein ElyMa_001571400 [Elysia marginata]
MSDSTQLSAVLDEHRALRKYTEESMEAIRSEMRAMKKTVCELQRNFQDMKREMSELKRETSELKNEQSVQRLDIDEIDKSVSKVHDEVRSVEDKIEKAERYSRRENLLLYGIREATDEDPRKYETDDSNADVDPLNTRDENHPFFNKTIFPNEVKSALKSLKSGKANGSDGIGPEFYPHEYVKGGTEDGAGLMRDCITCRPNWPSLCSVKLRRFSSFGF